MEQAINPAVAAVTALQGSSLPPPESSSPKPVASLQSPPIPPPPAPEAEPSPPKSTKRRLKRSVVWQHFVEVESDKNTAICNHCNRGINRGRNARNTTNLHQHLRTRHPELNIPPLASFPRKRKSTTAPGDPGFTAAAFHARSATANASIAAVPLARFLAEAGLPLAAGTGPAMHRLAAAWCVHGPLPNIATMRTTGIPNAIEATQAALRNALASVCVSVVVGDVVNGMRVVRCNSLSPRFERASYALAVFEEGERDMGLVLPRASFSMNGGANAAERLSPMLKGRISTLIAKYGILEKLHAVVIPEYSETFEMLSFYAPREDQQQQMQQGEAVFRHPVQEFMDEAARVAQEPSVPGSDPSEGGAGAAFGGSRTIPVVPCLVSLVERIFDVHVLENTWVESAIMVPVRNALSPNSPKRNVKKEKKQRRSLVDDMVPMDNGSAVFGRKDLDAAEESQAKVAKARDLLNNFLKKYGSLGTGRTVDNVDLTMVHELHKTLQVFDEACGLLVGGEGVGVDGEGSSVSVAIPVMRSVSRALVVNSKTYSGELHEMIKNVLVAVNQTQRDLENQEMYAVATMLDPRFKGRSFSSEPTSRFAEEFVLNACRALERTRENDPESAALASSFVAPAVKQEGGSMLGQFMDEVVHDKLDSSSSVTAYLAEPVFTFSEDIGKYWQRNAARWPDLTAVAAKYLSVPACARRPAGESAAISKLQFDAQDKGSMLFLRLNTALEI